MYLALTSTAYPAASFAKRRSACAVEKSLFDPSRSPDQFYRSSPSSAAHQPLKLQIPKIRRRLLQLQPQLPPRSRLVPAPNQNCLALLLIHQINQRDQIAHRKLRRHNRHAPVRADIHGVPLGPPRLPLFLTLHRHLHSRINPHPRSQIRPLGTSHIVALVVSVIQKWHVDLSRE